LKKTNVYSAKISTANAGNNRKYGKCNYKLYNYNEEDNII
jgi:hypothetical protein